MDGPLVSIIVPARNEVENIGSCVRSILGQSYAELELIVVDDSSTDGTREAALAAASGDPRARVIRAPSPPDGWVGKSWACWIGYRESRGEILLFVDADSRLAPWAVAGVVEEIASRGVDVVTAVPTYACRTLACGAVEVALTSTIRAFCPYWRVSEPGGSPWVYGGFFAVKRAAYEAVGEHESVRWSTVEDRDLARLLAERGYSIEMVRGQGTVKFCWANGFAEALEAIARISSRDAPLETWKALLACSLVAAAWLLPPASLIASAFGPAYCAASSAIALALETCHESLALLSGEVEASPLSILLAPLGGLIVALGVWRGHLVKAGRRAIEWKGREVSLLPPEQL